MRHNIIPLIKNSIMYTAMDGGARNALAGVCACTNSNIKNRTDAVFNTPPTHTHKCIVVFKYTRFFQLPNLNFPFWVFLKQRSNLC